MDRGWIKFHRQILDNHFLMNDDSAYIVFSKLLLLVNRNGEWAGGRRQLAKFFNMNDRTLYGVLQRLQKHGILVLSANPKYTILRVKNWHSYQGSKPASEAKRNRTLHENNEKVPFLQPLDQPPTQPPINRLESDESQPDSQPMSQLRGNHSATTRQHYNNNKKGERRIKRSTVKIDQDLAARETAALHRKPSSQNTHTDIADLFGGRNYGTRSIQ